jgi:serine/threonine protein kinase
MAEQAFTGSLKSGAMLDKYEIRGQIAAGGMAIIYKAYDATLDRYVAIKQIAPHLSSDDKFAARFKVEAQTLARLSGSQPNIVHVHELIQQDGQLYLVMEHVEGTTLRSLMDRGPVPLQTGLGVLLSASLGLRAMHAQNIVHRDLTPSNLMMGKDGALKITDFGLIGHSGGKTSLPMGTTRYMAPEMFTGSPVDPRADLYSLGMIAYEMFAGPEKFSEAFRDVLRDEKAQQVRWMHWHSNPALRPPPLKELQPGVPPLVSKIVERLMDKDVGRRFASADQFVRWLRRIFVMHVQGKSISVNDSQAMEKELDAESHSPAPAAPAASAAKAAPKPARGSRGAPAAAAAAATEPPPSDKTAPLPVQKWPLKRVIIWAAIIVTPLVALVIGLIVYKSNKYSEYVNTAQKAQVLADQKFDAKDYAAAERAYQTITSDYSDLKGIARYALGHSYMSGAEKALSDKRWDDADELYRKASNADAPLVWQSDFQKRFVRERDITEQMAAADAKMASGHFDEAREILEKLVKKYNDLDLKKLLEDLARQGRERQYKTLYDEAKKLYNEGKLEEAKDKAFKASQLVETPQVKELLETIDRRQQLLKYYTLAETAFKEAKFAEAARYFKYIVDHNLGSVELCKKRYNESMTQACLEQARSILKNVGTEAALPLYQEVLKYDPANAEAKDFLAKFAAAAELKALIEAANKAYDDKDWPTAIAKFTELSKRPDADDAMKTTCQTKIDDANWTQNVEKGDAAILAKDYDGALAWYMQAEKIKKTPELDDKITGIQNLKMMQQHIKAGKEALEAQNWKLAREEFSQALKYQTALKGRYPLDEDVNDLMKAVDYQYHKTEGKKLLDAGQAAASARFKIAAGYATTDKQKLEIQALIDQAGRLAPPKKDE